MAKFLFCIMMSAAFSALIARAQDPAEQASAPSVADAARAQRERQKQITPKRVITDADIEPEIRPAAPDTGASEQEVRAELEKNCPPSFFTMANLRQQITQLQSVATMGHAGMLTSFNRSALAGYENVEFPGKKEWEEKGSVATNHMVEEAGKGATRLEAIVEDNQNAITGRDPAALARMQKTWIDGILPYALWQRRTRDLMEDGKTRAKAYATGNPVGAAEHSRAAVERTELAVRGMLSELNIMEHQIRNVQRRFICDPTQWPHDPNYPDAPNALQVTYTQVSQEGYRLDLQGCDESHYAAVAVPSASDGNQGRAFCMDESGIVRMALDGNAATCMSR